MVLHEHAVDRKIRDMKFSAVLHGADPKDLEDKAFEAVNRKDNLLFGDPAEYVEMNEEEKKVLSEKMKKKFFAWSGVKKNG